MISQVKGVRGVFPVLGRYDVVVDVDDMNLADLGATVLRIGRVGGVVFTETLVEIEQ